MNCIIYISKCIYPILLFVIALTTISGTLFRCDFATSVANLFFKHLFSEKFHLTFCYLSRKISRAQSLSPPPQPRLLRRRLIVAETRHPTQHVLHSCPGSADAQPGSIRTQNVVRTTTEDGSEPTEASERGTKRLIVLENIQGVVF